MTVNKVHLPSLKFFSSPSTHKCRTLTLYFVVDLFTFFWASFSSFNSKWFWWWLFELSSLSRFYFFLSFLCHPIWSESFSFFSLSLPLPLQVKKKKRNSRTNLNIINWLINCHLWQKLILLAIDYFILSSSSFPFLSGLASALIIFFNFYFTFCFLFKESSPWNTFFFFSVIFNCTDQTVTYFCPLSFLSLSSSPNLH